MVYSIGRTMTKQRDIVVGLMVWMGAYGVEEDDMVKAGMELFAYLDSQDVAIKVGGQLPIDYGYDDAALNLAARGERLSMLKAGYTATMSLIGE